MSAISLDPAHRFADRQKKVLRQTYDDAWAEGVDSYTPDPDPEQPPADQDRATLLAGLTGAALLAARRLLPYEPPASPDPVRRAVALAPAFVSLNRMVAEISTLHPSAEHYDRAAALADGLATHSEAFAQALQDYLDSNQWRLDGGVSAAWAGESAGYAEAADADGQILEWQLDDAVQTAHCEDCLALSEMPPMPLADWPAHPGDGSTTCDVGCLCALQATGISILPGDTYSPQLSSDQEALVGKLTTAQADAMASVMSDAAYLD